MSYVCGSVISSVLYLAANCDLIFLVRTHVVSTVTSVSLWFGIRTTLYLSRAGCDD